MIEVRVGAAFERGAVLIDGVEFGGEEFYVTDFGARSTESASGIVLTVYSDELTKILTARRFSDLSNEIRKVVLSPGYSLISDEEMVQHVTIYRKVSGQLFMTMDFEFNAGDWKRLWSIKEYAKEFIHVLEGQGLINGAPRTADVVIEDEDATPNEDEIALLFEIQTPDKVIQEEVQTHVGLLSHLHELTRTSLLSKVRSGSVVLQLDFPDEAKVACEQYLLYFVQFLKDLGVEATAELQQEAGEVLFAVTPKNKDEALDKIRSALNVYLNLPASNLEGAETDVLTQRLASNIYHLKSQLALSQAVLQAKEATIEAQRFTIVQQERLLGGEIMVDSVVGFESTSIDRERVLDGIAEITKYEGKGFAVNLPEIYRRLKRLFSEKD